MNVCAGFLRNDRSRCPLARKFAGRVKFPRGSKQWKAEHMRHYVRIAAAAALGAALYAPIALAQGQPAQAQAEQNASVTDEKIDKAAVAVERVVVLKQAFQDRYAAAPDTERPKIAGEAQAELTKAVTDQGLSIEEYDNILQVAEKDAGVREKLLARLRTNAEKEDF